MKNAPFARPVRLLCKLASRNHARITLVVWTCSFEETVKSLLVKESTRWGVQVSSSEDVLVLIAVTSHHHLTLSAYLTNLTGNYCRFSNQIKHLWSRIVSPHRIRACILAGNSPPVVTQTHLDSPITAVSVDSWNLQSGERYLRAAAATPG